MAHIVIIRATFYSQLSSSLSASAESVCLAENARVSFIDVPGVFELPAALAMAIATKRYDGYICLGAVIRGETTHYDVVCHESARGVNDLAIAHQIPLGFGVITAENMNQALVRADAAQKDMGGSAARACLKMHALHKQYQLT